MLNSLLSSFDNVYAIAAVWIGLTFLAGAEIDPASLRRFLAPSLVIGGIGFVAPFVGAWALAWLVLHWHWQAAQIAGVALSTTSVAVVYAVMVETGLNRTD